MNKEEIIREINNCKNKINTNNSKIKTLDDRVDELIRIKMKLDTTEDKFNEQYYKNSNRFDSMASTFTNVKFAVKCAEHMKDLIGGSEYKRALDGIKSSMDNVKNQINLKESEIDELKKENSRLRNKIMDLEVQLVKASIVEVI